MKEILLFFLLLLSSTLLASNDSYSKKDWHRMSDKEATMLIWEITMEYHDDLFINKFRSMSRFPESNMLNISTRTEFFNHKSSWLAKECRSPVSETCIPDASYKDSLEVEFYKKHEKTNDNTLIYDHFYLSENNGYFQPYEVNPKASYYRFSRDMKVRSMKDNKTKALRTIEFLNSQNKKFTMTLTKSHVKFSYDFNKKVYKFKTKRNFKDGASEKISDGLTGILLPFVIHW